MDYWNVWWFLDWLIDEFVESITEMRDDCEIDWLIHF